MFPIVNLKELFILYCFICLSIKRFLDNFLKATFELIFVLSKFNKKKFALGSFELILQSFKTEYIFLDHSLLKSIALLTHLVSLIAAIPAAKATLLILNGGLTSYMELIIFFEE